MSAVFNFDYLLSRLTLKIKINRLPYTTQIKNYQKQLIRSLECHKGTNMHRLITHNRPRVTLSGKKNPHLFIKAFFAASLLTVFVNTATNQTIHFLCDDFPTDLRLRYHSVTTFHWLSHLKSSDTDSL